MKISVTVHKYIPIRLRTFFCTVTGIVTTVWNGIRNRTEKIRNRMHLNFRF